MYATPEVLTGIYKSRKNHKLQEWHTFCEWIESLPYSELITGEREELVDENALANDHRIKTDPIDEELIYKMINALPSYPDDLWKLIEERVEELKKEKTNA